MFSTEETKFIRGLARDFCTCDVDKTQFEIPRTVSRVEKWSTVAHGGVDYSKFERLVAELDEEESKVHVEKDSAVSNSGHRHGSCCDSSSGLGCLHDHSHERRIFEKSFEDKLKAIRLFRTEGNRHFSMKCYEDATISYKRALLYLDYSFGDTDEEENLLDIERLKCHINLAAVFLEREMYDEVLSNCRLGLKIDPDCVKGLYRMGIAYLKKGDLQEAQDHLYAALKRGSAEGRDTLHAIEKAIRDLNVKWREYRAKAGDIARAAFKT